MSLVRVRKSFVNTATMSRVQKALAIGKTALSIANGLKMLVNVEYKRAQFSQGLTALSSTGTMYHLTDIDQSLTAAGRTGDSILARYIKMRLAFIPDDDQTKSDFVRIIIIVDTENQGASPAVSDYLTSTDFMSEKNVDNTDRFKCLYDRTVTVGPLGGRVVEIYKKLNFHIRFTASEGTDEDDNHMYMLLISYRVTYPLDTAFSYTLAYHDN